MELFKLLGTIVVDNAEAKKALEETGEKGQQTESKMSKAFGVIGKGAAVAGKAILTGLAAGASACAALSVAAIKSYADYEQLVGGVETLFGSRGAKTVEEYAKMVGKSVKDVEAEFGMLQQAQSDVMENAANAYKTAGMSANEYMETASGLAAALNQSSASQLESAALADQAIIDMSDNAAKMGTSMESIKTAYAGFAKQNYTMLDNLKLGYGGTREEMQRLLDDAGKLAGKKFDISSFADVTEAIHVMQEEMGIAGTTAKEASATIQGSLGMLKGSWSNLMTGLSDPEADLTSLINNVFTSITTFAGNLVPRVTQVLSGIATAFTQLVPLLTNEIPNLFNQVLPPLIEGAVALVDGLVQALPNIISAITNALPALIDGVVQLVVGLCAAIPQIIQPIIAALPEIMQSIIDALPTLIPALIDGVVQLVLGIAQAINQIAMPLLQALPDIVISLVEALVNNLPIFIEGFMSLFMGIVQALPQIVESLVAAIPTIVTMLVDAITANLPMLIDGLVQLVVALGQALPQIIESLVEALPGVVSTIIDALMKNLPVIIDGLVRIMLAIVYALPQIIQELVAAIPLIITLLIEATIKLLPVIITGLIQVVLGIVAALPAIFASLIAAIPGALEGIWESLGHVFGGIGAWFGEKFGAAKDAAVNAWNGAKEKFNAVKEKCVEGFNNFKDKVGTKFSEAKEAAQQKWADAKEKWSGIKDKVVDGFSKLKDNVGTKFNDAKTKALEKWNDAKTKFSGVKDKVVSAFDNLKDKVSPLFSKAKENATQTWSDVKSIFNKFKNGDIVGAFSDLGSLLKSKFSGALTAAKQGFSKIKQIGKDLVTGLWNGITNKFSWLTSKIKGFASSVTNKLKSFFGIKSPSRVMRDEVGKHLAEGIAVGITANSEVAESAAEKLGKNILDAAQKKLDNYKTYNDLTLADEVAFWDSVRLEVAEGTDARIEADKKYFEAKQSLNDQIVDAEDALQKSLDEIDRKITERQKSVMDSFDLFKSFEIDEFVSPADMQKNMDSNIHALEQYQGIMASLREKIGGTALFAELEDMGVGALNKAGSLNAMSEMNLQAFVEKYDKLAQLSKEVAQEGMTEEVIAETAGAWQTFTSSMSDCGVEIVDTDGKFNALAKTALASGESIAKVVKDYMIAPFETLNSTLSNVGSQLSDLTSGKIGAALAGFGMPTADVEWHDKAMNNAMILNKPTIFGYNSATGKFLGGGETGSEVVSGTNTLMGMIQTAVAEKNEVVVYYLKNIIEVLATYFPQLIDSMGFDIRLDSGALVGELAVPMNQALGKLSTRKDRGR